MTDLVERLTRLHCDMVIAQEERHQCDNERELDVLRHIAESAELAFWTELRAGIEQQARELAEAREEALKASTAWEIAKSQVERLRGALEAEMEPACTCSPEYTSRQLQDPSCRYCDQDELRAALQERHS